MADRIRAPLLIEQGELDLVVPPSQSEGMVETIKRNGGEERVKYILFEGEGHGFRQAANQKRHWRRSSSGTKTCSFATECSSMR